MAATPQHPKQIDPIFSTRQSETDAGQFLEVRLFFSDASHDSESERLADVGAWLPVEDVTAAQERLERTLRRRNASRFGEAP